MITESHNNYKGYTVRLRAVTGNGFWYIISKQIPNASSPGGMKNIILRRVGFNFIDAAKLMQKAINYIDNYQTQLEEKFNKLTINNK